MEWVVAHIHLTQRSGSPDDGGDMIESPGDVHGMWAQAQTWYIRWKVRKGLGDVAETKCLPPSHRTHKSETAHETHSCHRRTCQPTSIGGECFTGVLNTLTRFTSPCSHSKLPSARCSTNLNSSATWTGSGTTALQVGYVSGEVVMATAWFKSQPPSSVARFPVINTLSPGWVRHSTLKATGTVSTGGRASCSMIGTSVAFHPWSTTTGIQGTRSSDAECGSASPHFTQGSSQQVESAELSVVTRLQLALQVLQCCKTVT